MGEIQRALNVLVGTMSGGIATVAGLGKKMFKDIKNQKPIIDTEVGSSANFTTKLSSDEAAQKAFKSANEMVLQKVRSKNVRDAKTGRFIRVYKEPEGGKQ